jgi:hypothetical protein
MRTTIDIDDQLLLYAKHQAVEQGCTIKQIMEDALRDFFHIKRSSTRLSVLPLFQDKV